MRRSALALAIGGTLVLVYALVAAQTLWATRGYRQHPVGDLPARILAREWPHTIVARFFLFKQGSPLYRTTVWHYVATNPPANTPWNRSLLRRDLFAMDREALFEHLHAYPFPPDEGMLPLISTALEDGAYNVLLFLAGLHSPEAAKLFTTHVTALLEDAELVEYLREAPRYILSAVGHSPAPLEFVEQAWTRLDEDRGYFLTALADGLAAEPASAPELLAWVADTMTDLPPYADEVLQVLARFLSMEATRQQALALIAPAAALYEEVVGEPDGGYNLAAYVDADEREEVCRLALDRPDSEGLAFVAEMAHFVLDQDQDAGYALLDPLLERPDSTLRKAAIVLLARHESVRGAQLLDEAFKGAAPRRTYFKSWEEYLYSSAAVSEYEALARHDYVGHPKEWPPLGSRDGVLEQDIAAWREFIETYPWAPGTDDAYYRLMSAQYLADDHAAALRTAKEFLGRELADNDAEPYVLNVIRHLALMASDLDPPLDDPLLDAVKAIVLRPVGIALMSGGDCAELQQALAASDLELLGAALGADEEDLTVMAELAGICLDRPWLPDRLRAAAKTLSTRYALEGVLFGRFSHIGWSEYSAGDEEWQALEEAGRIGLDWAERIERDWRTSSGLTHEELQSELTWLRLLDRGCYACASVPAFQKATAALERIRSIAPEEGPL